MAALFIVLPYCVESYGAAYHKPENIAGELIAVARFEIAGMGCKACAVHIDTRLGEERGVLQSISSYEKQQSIVFYDSSLVSPAKIAGAIASTGYTVERYMHTPEQDTR